MALAVVLLLAFAGQPGRAQGVRIGAGDTGAATGKSTTMAEQVAFSIDPGNPAVTPNSVAVGQPATFTFHVSFSWPASAHVVIQDQNYEAVGENGGTIAAASAYGCSSSISGDGNAATLTQWGGQNYSAFDIAVTS